MFVRRSKFRPPELPAGSIGRPSVEARLSPDVRVLSIVAGPGYGKTVLATRLFERSRSPKLWYGFDPSDADVAIFAARIDAELDGLGAARLPAVETGRLAPKDVGSYLAERIASLREAPLFAFDDVHEIEGGSAVDAVVELVLRATKIGTTFLVSGRSMPLALHRIAVTTRLARIDQNDLVFTNGETDAYLALAGARGGDLAPLVAGAEGWPAGLALIASAPRSRRRTGPGFSGVEPDGTRRRLFEYLAREVLDAVSPEERRLLVETSILEEVDVALGDAVARTHDAAAVFASLANRNLFVQRLSDDAFKVHRLFREFLAHALVSERSAAQIWELHYRAADALWARGERQRAIAHRLAAGAVDQAARELESAAFELLRAGALSALGALLDGIPRARIEASYVLLAALGRVLWQRGDPGGALAALRSSMSLARAARANDVAAEAARACAPIYGARAAFEPLRELLEETLALEPLQESSRTGLRTTLGAVCVDTGRYDEALAIFKEITPFLIARDDVATQASVLHNTAVAHQRRGDLFAALSTYERALAMKERAGHRLSALVTLGDLVYLRTLLGDEDEAERLAEQLLAGASDFGATAMIARAHEARGLLALRGGDVAAAESEYDEAARATEPGDVLVLPYVLHGRAQCLFAEKRYAEAERACLEAEALFRSAGRAQQSAPVLVTRGAAALASGNVPAALALADDAASAAAAGTDGVLDAAASLEVAELLVRCAERSFGKDRARAEDLARRSARHALALVHERDYGFLFRTKAAAFERVAPYLRAAQASPANAPELRHPPLAVSMLGEFAVRVAGRRLPEEVWKRRKAREIFSYIASRRGRPVSRGQLLRLYWPEVDAERANDALRVTISAIRKAVGNVIKYEASAYRFDPPPGSIVDTARFEDAVERARAAGAAGEDAAAEKWYAAALDAYQGDFLDGRDDGGWEWRERERLRAAALEAARRLATAPSAGRANRGALERWLAIAPFDMEAVTLGLETLEHDAGAAAARHEYENWRRRYRVAIGADAPHVWPSAQPPDTRRRAGQLEIAAST